MGQRLTPHKKTASENILYRPPKIFLGELQLRFGPGRKYLHYPFPGHRVMYHESSYAGNATGNSSFCPVENWGSQPLT